ncbi:alpha/beta fold hydrolase [Planomonospora alba]|uniref:Alpha/beta fold hydrolase n=1 Tax=Planomonospora alba TaxID=161354 RepID=A0ABP6MTN9_9ACTN
MTPDSIVFGAAGFVGRTLVAELLRRGRRVAAAVRGPGDRLTSWLAGQEVDTAGLTVVTGDVTAPGLGLAETGGLAEVRDVYNTAARFAFGLTVPEARSVNVTGALHVTDWAATRPGLRRLVHVSGYRVGGGRPDYRREGAYEASKKEGDAAVRARAAELGVPLTVVNPATVIGPGQFIGLASLVRDLWYGRLPVLPGGRGVFVPVVDGGHLARFMAALPEHAETAGGSYWVLDDATPELPELVALLAEHLGVPAPRRSLPVGLLRRLPRALTGADPETLTFLSAERYDTGPAREFAERAGLRMPPVGRALRHWADDLVAARFGDGPASGRSTAPGDAAAGAGGAGGGVPGPGGGPRTRPYGFRDVAGVRTWVTGEPEEPAYVLFHGLPLDADSWAGTAGLLDGPVLAPDLPGLGRSAPAAAVPPGPGRAGRAGSACGVPDSWTAALLAPVTTRPVLVGHSLGCGPALRYAAAHPDRVAALVLVAPAFLQAPAGRFLRSRAAVPVLRRMPRRRLADRLGVPAGALADLARPGAARRAAGALRAGHTDREELRLLLDRVEVPVVLVAGSEDPLPADRAAEVIPGTGHYPQLTRPGEVARVLRGVRATADRGDGGDGGDREDGPGVRPSGRRPRGPVVR